MGQFDDFPLLTDEDVIELMDRERARSAPPSDHRAAWVIRCRRSIFAKTFPPLFRRCCGIWLIHFCLALPCLYVRIIGSCKCAFRKVERRSIHNLQECFERPRILRIRSRHGACSIVLKTRRLPEVKKKHDTTLGELIASVMDAANRFTRDEKEAYRITGLIVNRILCPVPAVARPYSSRPLTNRTIHRSG